MKLKMGDTMKKIKQKHLETKCKIRAYVYRVVMFTLLPMLLPQVAFAEDNPLEKAKSGLETIKGTFETIVICIGGIIILFAAIEIGNGVKSGESAQVTGGIKQLIGGSIMAAAGAVLKIFT